MGQNHRKAKAAIRISLPVAMLIHSQVSMKPTLEIGRNLSVQMKIICHLNGTLRTGSESK